MKMRLLSGAVLGLLANGAGAMALNPEGIGQVLLYPYYTINAGNQTLLSVVNTQNAGKVMRVRFREAFNGREVLDFNLYLSPYDVWTATVFATDGLTGHAGDGAAGAGLLTPDNSCTDPAIKTGTTGITEMLPDGRNFVSFVNTAYAQPNNDSGPIQLFRTRTGHIELIQMADVVGATLKAITHVNGVPANCAAVAGAQPGPDYLSPTGGLFGSASIINVANGTLFGANAEAISGFYADTGNLFSPASSASPDLNSGQDLGGITATSYVFAEEGSLITSSWNSYAGGPPGSVDAVSSLFAADVLFNEYEFNQTTGAVTSEWVITFPTKTYYVDPARRPLYAAGYVIPPFSVVFGGDASMPGTACEPFSFELFDREERTPPPEGGFPEPRPEPYSPTLCWESQTIIFGSLGTIENTIDYAFAPFGPTSPLFGTPLYYGADPVKAIGPSGTSGLMVVTLASVNHTLNTSLDGNTFSGLPAIGFLAKQFTNKNVTPGVLGNYAGLYRHHSARSCLNYAGECQ